MYLQEADYYICLAEGKKKKKKVLTFMEMEMTPRVKPGAQGEDMSTIEKFSWTLG